MQGTTGHGYYQLGLVLLHGLAVVSLIGLALLGQVPGEVAGWLVKPAVPAGFGREGLAPRRRRGCWYESLVAMGCYLALGERQGLCSAAGCRPLWRCQVE